MPLTPVDEHTEEFEQLAGLVALEILDGDELLRFEQHAAVCARCKVMVRVDREALARTAPEMDPSPDFKQRLMARAAQELAATAQTTHTAPRTVAEPPYVAQPEPIPLRRPPNVIPFWRRSRTWTSALAAVLVVALVSAGAFTYQNQVVASYPLYG